MASINPTPSSSVKRTYVSSPSSSTQKRPKLDPAAYMPIKDKMKQTSDDLMWVMRKDCAKDESAWRLLVSDVFSQLMDALESTNMKGSVIGRIPFSQAKRIVESFNTQEMNEWQEGVWKGVDKNDWEDLI
jgi:hypothetical protein